jgi:hypothetical protein
MANKVGDVIMIYGSPVKKDYPIGEARLLKKLTPRSDSLEYWSVEYINEPGVSYNQFIPAKHGADKEQI